MTFPPEKIIKRNIDTIELSNGIIVHRIYSSQDIDVKENYINDKKEQINLYLTISSDYTPSFHPITSEFIFSEKIYQKSNKNQTEHLNINQKNDTFNEYSLLIQIPKNILNKWENYFKIPKWIDLDFLLSEETNQLSINISQKKIIMIIMEILRFKTINNFNFLDFECLVLNLCSNILSIQDVKIYQNKIDNILDIIHHDPFMDISINDLAKLAGTNESYLRQEFKDKMGITIGTYIKDMKLKEAKKLLIYNNLKIKDIAKLCGYNDIGYFSKIIKNVN
ncbi:helix-turn-helix transcriptional regulator [Acinetobacter sp.]|uniref:helix-turn-helix transcriptional regulator n=1 Tax=Acinetobacter sp. TaxID=472 RepID=UPI0031DAD01E